MSKLKTQIYKIKGMNCPSCASLLELDLEDVGVKAKCSYAKSVVEIEGEHDHKKVVETVSKSGYSVSSIE